MSSCYDSALASFQLVTNIGGVESSIYFMKFVNLQCIPNDLTMGPVTVETEGDTFTSPINVTVTSGLLQEIYMFVSSDVAFGVPSNVGTGAGLALATVDPYVEIDPSFPMADQFSLVFSPYIGNAVAAPTAVPEPSALVLMSSVMLAFVAARRRFGYTGRGGGQHS
jgi:hypothetical protein